MSEINNRSLCKLGEKNPMFKHGMWNTKTYSAWASMIDRCGNENHKAFRSYGGRGIKVCERWKTFSNFLKDMGVKPEGMTLERINNDKGYSPKNCKWATRKEQASNRCNSRLVTFKGKKNTISEWGRVLGINIVTLRKRLNAGWPINRAFTLEPLPHTMRPHSWMGAKQ